MDLEHWLKRVPTQNPHLAWRIVDDECIIVDPQGSAATVLNQMGARIWELVDGKRSFGDIVDVILTEYEVDRGRAEGDAKEFVVALTERNLIHFDGDATPV